MSVKDIAQATFWGAMLILALLTIYFWFVVIPANIVAGIVSTSFALGFGVLAYKMS